MQKKLLEILQSQPGLLLIEIEAAQGQVSERQSRIESDCLAALPFSRRQIAQVVGHFAQVEMSLGVFRVQLNGLLVAGQGFVVFALAIEGIAQTVEGEDRIRLHRQCFSVAPLRLFHLLQMKMHQTKTDQGIGLGRIDFKNLLIGTAGLVVQPLLKIKVPQSVKRFQVMGVLL